MLHLWIIAILLGAIEGKEICFKRLGCFSDDPPWGGILQRPFKILPLSPEAINTRFLLYTNENPNKFQEIKAPDPQIIGASNFKTNRKTHFIIHGFIDKGEVSWLTDMCKKIIQVEEANCICVDWRKGSRTLYSKAVNNIRVVGAEVSYFINVLSSELGYSPSNIHIIGHSLGAHTAGEAGKRTHGQIGRITGLDPAEPGFQGTPEEVRLDPSDAMFVDVIHTDSSPLIPNMGLGMSQIVGHLDFFPNGGKQMPGCKKNILSTIVDINGIWEGTRDFAACNHLRSYKYYSESIINPDGFLGYPCASYDAFEKNKCFPCPAEGCPRMGHFADRFKGKTRQVGQTFFLNTGDAKNFTCWRYRVSVTLNGTKNVKGSIKIAIYGNKGNSRQYDIFKGSLKPGANFTKEIDVELNVGTVQKVKFLWFNNVINLVRPKLGASNVTVQTGEDGIEHHFCGSYTVRKNVLQTLYPC
ncbi:pancreatic lipase-related protein 2-like [Tachyglossus aculeatus]|uniref:pancreatic lipase-related protein 2-like n=1 Tax=Tachyglossus aculeatus TaxID=9261 RepID=UPI0018F5C891|nr:pancreatic lipase-related protein 2-like [Tachyglossus aculeatus]